MTHDDLLAIQFRILARDQFTSEEVAPLTAELATLRAALEDAQRERDAVDEERHRVVDSLVAEKTRALAAEAALAEARAEVERLAKWNDGVVAKADTLTKDYLDRSVAAESQRDRAVALLTSEHATLTKVRLDGVFSIRESQDASASWHAAEDFLAALLAEVGP